MILKKIKNKTEYLRSIERFEELFQAKKGSKESGKEIYNRIKFIHSFSRNLSDYVKIGSRSIA